MTKEEGRKEAYRLNYERIWRWAPKVRRLDWTPYQEAVVDRRIKVDWFEPGEGPDPVPYEEWLKTLPPCDVEEDGPEAEERLWWNMSHGQPEKAKAEYGGKLPTFDEWWASWHDGKDGD